MNQEELITALEDRFIKNKNRHEQLTWQEIKEKLIAQPDKIDILSKMEASGGEPDILGNDFIFVDCSPETPIGRRSICYDRLALETRKKNKPANDAITMAADMGIELLTETEYATLQSYGEFDTKTSSWIKTPDDIRNLGGALFCDCRYGRVFTYHNGADSYYSARGFRGKLKL